MKKLLSILFASLLIASATTVSASDIAESKGTVPKVDASAVKIDGEKDAAYDQALTLKIDQFLRGNDDGASATAYLLWADGTFFFFAEVTDADVCIPNEAVQEKRPWEADSVEIFFDFGNMHEDFAKQFRIDVTGFPSYYAEGDFEHAYGPENAAQYFRDYMAIQTNDGYNVEMSINLDSYNVKDGMDVGINLQLNDRVDNGASESVYNMASTYKAGSWDVDLYDYVTLGAMAEAPATDAPATEAPATEAPATDAPATDAPATDAPAAAPQTFDVGVIAAVAAVVSLAGYAVSKKNR